MVRRATTCIEDAAAFAARSLEKFNDPIQRKAGLRAIAKSIDNSFGEMFWGTLFWNRTLKDAGIGSFLSLGRALGFSRYFGRDLLSPPEKACDRIFRYGASATRDRDAQNKTSFVLVYTGSAKLLAGSS